MDLKSGYPFWAIRNGLMRAFPRLEENLACDVVVIGGGITGALIADELAGSGKSVVVLEQRDVAWGSTAASTALLQYEIDTHLVDLSGMVGAKPALQAYRACAEAVRHLGSLAQELGGVDFAAQSSLYYASSRWHAGALRDEFALRHRHGFDVTWLERGEIAERFGIDAPGAILNGLAACVDPYRFTHRLLARVARRGGETYDRTRVAGIESSTRGVTVRTEDGHVVQAGHLVVAAGYASQQWLDERVARNRSSYAFISDPLDRQALGCLAETMVWESARPYLYLRGTRDHRVLVGGADDSVDIPDRRDRRVQPKQEKLLAKVRKLLPSLDLRPAFAWAGTFAETTDGLPFFGAHPKYGPRVLFAMAYGGNGITYSMIGRGLIRAAVEGRRHPLAKLFGFGRLDA
jgi:glycine/D-amino acid oxidase-like deaminating enzyme